MALDIINMRINMKTRSFLGCFLSVVCCFTMASCSRSKSSADPSSSSVSSYNDKVVAAAKLYQRGDQDGAVVMLRQVVHDDPGNDRWKIVLAGFLVETAPLKNGFPVSASNYEEPLHLIKQVKLDQTSSLNHAQIVDARIIYAICLSMSGQVNLGITKFEDIFSDPDALVSGGYGYGLSVYAHDLISIGRAEDARSLLKKHLDEKWDPAAAAVYIQIMVSNNVATGTSEYNKLVSLHGDRDVRIKRGLCDGLADAHELNSAQKCFLSITTEQNASPLSVKYANWRLASFKTQPPKSVEKPEAQNLRGRR